MNTIQITKPLHIFLLGCIKRESMIHTSNILALLLTSLLCSVIIDPQHQNKLTTGLVFASSTEAINKYTHHLDASAQNILGMQC